VVLEERPQQVGERQRQRLLQQNLQARALAAVAGERRTCMHLLEQADWGLRLLCSPAASLGLGESRQGSEEGSGKVLGKEWVSRQRSTL
jgi:hypothetical protein